MYYDVTYSKSKRQTIKQRKSLMAELRITETHSGSSKLLTTNLTWLIVCSSGLVGCQSHPFLCTNYQQEIPGACLCIVFILQLLFFLLHRLASFLPTSALNTQNLFIFLHLLLFTSPPPPFSSFPTTTHLGLFQCKRFKHQPAQLWCFISICVHLSTRTSVFLQDGFV